MNLGCAQILAEWDCQGGGALAAPSVRPAFPPPVSAARRPPAGGKGPGNLRAQQRQKSLVLQSEGSPPPPPALLPGVRHPLPTPHCPVSPADSSSPGSESVNPGAVGTILYPPPRPASTAPALGS